MAAVFDQTPIVTGFPVEPIGHALFGTGELDILAKGLLTHMVDTELIEFGFVGDIDNALGATINTKKLVSGCAGGCVLNFIRSLNWARLGYKIHDKDNGVYKMNALNNLFQINNDGQRSYILLAGDDAISFTPTDCTSTVKLPSMMTKQDLLKWRVYGETQLLFKNFKISIELNLRDYPEFDALINAHPHFKHMTKCVVRITFEFTNTGAIVVTACEATARGGPNVINITNGNWKIAYLMGFNINRNVIYMSIMDIALQNNDMQSVSNTVFTKPTDDAIHLLRCINDMAKQVSDKAFDIDILSKFSKYVNRVTLTTSWCDICRDDIQVGSIAMSDRNINVDCCYKCCSNRSDECAKRLIKPSRR
jgi:hypothetical protein